MEGSPNEQQQQLRQQQRQQMQQPPAQQEENQHPEQQEHNQHAAALLAQQQQNHHVAALVAQIEALKESVENLRTEGSLNQAETQRLGEVIDQQTAGMNSVRASQYEGAVRVSTLIDGNESSSQYTPNNGAIVAHNHKKLYDLPQFSGNPEDWPLFLASYQETTGNFGYSAIENTIRLQRCLQGEAKEAVKSLIIHHSNVEQVITTLGFRFGRPDLMVKAQLHKVQNFPTISEARIDNIIPFATMVENVVAFLSAAKCEQHLANPILLEDLVMKLPVSKRYEWARYASTITPYTTVRDFAKWTTELAKVIQFVPQLNPPVNTRGQTTSTRRILHANENQETSSDVVAGGRCVRCGDRHQLIDCESFRNLPINERWELVKNKHLCFSCLKVGHGTSVCRTKRRCNVRGCGKFHNKLLHANTISPPTRMPGNDATATTSQQPQTARTTSTSSIRMHTCQMRDSDGLLFRILPVTLSGPTGDMQTYAMFDEGSSITVLEESVADQLGLKGPMQPLTLQWYGSKVVTEPSRRVAVEVRGVGEGYKYFSLRDVRTIKALSLPSQSFNKTEFKHLKDIPVQNYQEAKPVLMIGLDNCHLGVAREVKEDLKENKIIAAHTRLGWVVYGPQHSSNIQLPVVMHIREVDTLKRLDKLVEEYFTLESLGAHRSDTVVESEEDTRARKVLTDTTKRIGKQFETGLLWCKDEVILPDSFDMAMKRLHSIENKMKRNPEFASQYKERMKYYLDQNYARELEPEEIETHTSRTWYLPHFGVTSQHKPGKLRIVFDAAAEVKGVSLNSMLIKGPEQAKSLLTVLFQFRQGNVGVVADIQEMFSQIKIQPADQSSQRFLWRDGQTDKPVKAYVMTSMIFGAACSPCSAEYIKNKNAKEFENECPEAVKTIIENHYVDDFVCSFDSDTEAERISMEVQRIHAEGGFRLRSFLSNNKNIQKNLNQSACPLQSSVNLESDKGVEKVLGMYWDTEDDTFRFQLKFAKIDKKVLEAARPPTKRETLSIVMAVFDPYGFLADFLIFSKILLQNTWKTGMGWDDPLPQDLHCQWKLWWKEVENIKQFQLKRCYSPNIHQATSIELHIFTDASESAFAAVGYFRIQHETSVDISFAFGKTRCAPKKLLSILRLELQAAVLGSRLRTTIEASHYLEIARVVFWSDSRTALWWIRSPHRRFKPFVAHRVAEILETSNASDWKWVPTELNVADAATRAISPPRFVPDNNWVTGPDFLRYPEERWPEEPTIQVPDTLHEELRKQKILHMKQTNDSIININNYSSFSKVSRIIAWILRIRRHLSRVREGKTTRDKDKQIKSVPNRRDRCHREELEAAEIKSAEHFLCRQAQKEEYLEEISSLKEGQAISKCSTINGLTPCLDDEGLLRVNGRIDAAYFLPLETRRPIILPPGHPLTRLIIQHYHHKLHHQNDALTINEIRRRYWIPRLKSGLKNVKGQCEICKIARAKPAQPLMGQLPIDRLTPFIRPFTYTGLDYFGPISVAIGRRREKRWVALFTCLTIRAIHLELAADLSTDAFILCLRNFINRRGVPIRIRSDNGTNFIGAHRELNRESQIFDFDAIRTEMATNRIDWKFNCPLNPSEGGAWERMVQSVKKILNVTLSNEAPRVETLQSLLIEAENIINSRPLTELPVSCEEEEPLTPNHFLLGCPNSTQTPNLDDAPICCRKQWKISQQLKNRFWKRWVLEYLPMLTKRSKWHATVPPLRVGDLVLICDATQPRSKWQRGRIVNVYPAADGQVRSAEVKTSHGTLRRPASKLAVLQVDSEPLRGFTEGGMSA